MKYHAMAAAFLVIAGAQPASAQVAVEAMLLKGRGSDTIFTQIGVGYDFKMSGFRLSPMVSTISSGSDFRIFGRGEVGYTIPAIAEVGAGVRFNRDYRLGYLSVAVPIVPTIRLKGNLGEDFFEIGARFSF